MNKNISERRQGNFAAFILVYERVHLSNVESGTKQSQEEKKVTNGEISYALVVAHVSTGR